MYLYILLYIDFILSCEDKTNPQSIGYWFRCVDLDGDGVIRAHEVAEYYKEQLRRLESLGQQAILVEDVLCQMCDLLHKQDDTFHLKDFLKADVIHQCGICFDMLFDVNKFLDFEESNPFLAKQQNEDGLTAWSRYSRTKYQELLEPDEENDWNEDDL